MAQELDPAWFGNFQNSLVAITPQGFLRQWDAIGLVSPKAWDDALEILRHLAVVIISPDDLDKRTRWKKLRSYARITLVVSTVNRHGAHVYHQGLHSWCESRETEVIDATGAGDVFASAFLIRYSENFDPIRATYFGNVAASYSIEGEGVPSIPTRATIDAWIRKYPFDRPS